MPKVTKKPAAKRAAKPAGKLIGRTLVDNEAFDLYLLPGTFKGPWEKAKAWAAGNGGELPSRIDLLVLWQRAAAEFEKQWYWSSEQCAGFDAYAWCQSFGYGGQSGNRKDGELRARAVRRLTIR